VKRRPDNQAVQGKEGSSVVIIGFVLLAASAIFGIDLVAKNRYKIPSLHVFGENIGLGGSARLYILGAITGAALMLGLVLLLAGLRRKSSKATARRRERKAATAREREMESLQAENSELRSQLSNQEDSPSTLDRDGQGASAGVDSSA
jgi:hypothetical protein